MAAALPQPVIETQNELGRGAYATVVEVEYLGLKAAAKKLHPVLIGEAEERNTVCRRFEEECRLLSQLHHPNIVQFLGVYFEDVPHNLPVLVMEYLPTTLAAYLKRERIAPSINIGYNILHGVALGLRYLHERPSPIIHRDLTANNVLLSHDLTTAKISDLGVARAINLTPLTQAPGTTCYMPPEALVADPVYTTEIDVFSFGILMLHLFSAQWPVPTDPPVIPEQNGCQILPLTEADRRQKYFDCLGRGNALRDLIYQCIDNNPEARPRAKDVQRRIADAIANCRIPLPVVTPDSPYPMVHRSSKSSRRDLELTVGELEMQLEEAKLELKDGHVTLINAQIEAHAREERLVADCHAKLEKKNEELKARKTTYERELATLRERLALIESAKKATAASMEALIATKDEKIEKFSEMIRNQRERLRNALEDEITLHVFSPQATLSWKDCAPLPAPMLGAQAVVVGTGKIYVGSGETSTTASDYTLFEYDFIDNTWKNLPSCPVRLFGLGHLQIEGVALVGGVTREDTISGAVYTLDKDGWTATVIPAMMTPRHSPTIVNYNSTLLAIGGAQLPAKASSLLKSIEIYKNGRWYNALNSLPEPRSAMSHVIIDNMCYFIGGYHKSHGESSKEVLCGYLPALVEHTRSRAPSVGSHTSSCSGCSNVPSVATWSKKNQIEDTPHFLSTPVTIGGCLLVVGGYSNPGLLKATKIFNDIHVYCPTNKKWVEIASLPSARAQATAISLPTGELVVIGGRDSKLERSSNVVHGALTLNTPE